jgi:hypothetical protein
MMMAIKIELRNCGSKMFSVLEALPALEWSWWWP